MTAKSRYLASIGHHHPQQKHDYHDPKMDMALSLDDPPPPPPNPPTKQRLASSSSDLKTRRASSAATSRTSSMSNSSSGEAAGRRLSSKSRSGSSNGIRDDSEPPASISVASAGDAISINYDEILNEEKSSFDSNTLSVPVLSISSEESRKKDRRSGGYNKKKPTPEAGSRGRDQYSGDRRSSSKNQSKSYDGQSIESQSYVTVGDSLDSVLSPPPPPPPGTPPNVSSKKKYSSSAGKSVKSSKSNKSGYSSKSGSGGAGSMGRSEGYSQRSGKKSEYSGVDFDLNGLGSDQESKSVNTKSVSTMSKSKSRDSRYGAYDDILYDDKSDYDNYDDYDHQTADSKSKSKASSYDIEENDSGSVETEVLRYGEVTESKSALQETVETDIQSAPTNQNESLQSVDYSSVSASEKNLSVAEKRRRKAKANANSTPLKDIEEEGKSMDRHNTSGLKKSEKNLSTENVYDPQLVLKDSDNELDMSEDEREDTAIQKKKKKKKVGFFSKIFSKSPEKRRNSQSPKKERVKEEKTGRISPFRRRSSSRSRGMKDNEKPQSYDKASKSTFDSKKKPTLVETGKLISLTKVESGLSYDKSQKSLKPLSKLDSDLSLDVDEPKFNVLSRETSSTNSHANKKGSVRPASSSKDKNFKSVDMENFNIEQKDMKGIHSTNSGSRSSRDPPDSSSRSVNDGQSALSDEVSEVTNPTFVSNKMDPPEEKRSVRSDDSEKLASPLVSVTSSRTESDHTPLISNNHLYAGKQKNLKERQQKPRNAVPILEDEVSEDREQQLENEFFGGLGWGDDKDHNSFFLTPNASNDNSSASKDPFEDPFYPDVSSGTSRKEKNCVTAEYEDDELLVPDLRSSRKSMEDSAPSTQGESRSRSLSPTKVDVNKVKQERRNRSTRNLSPTSRSSRNLSPTKGLDLSKNNKLSLGRKSKPQSISNKSSSSSYLISPGIKIGQNKSLVLNDNRFYSDNNNDKSPSRAPSFLAKRQSRDKKEVEIRAKLQKQADANAKMRLENTTKAAETGKRRGNLIEKTSAEWHLSPLKSRSRSQSPTKTLSAKKDIVMSSNMQKGSFRVSNNISMDKRDNNSMHNVKSSNAKSESYTERLLKRKQGNTRSNSFLQNTSYKATAVKDAKSFEAPDIADPIQRAGMRILSTAAIPIQTEIRRYLGKKAAEDRIWAIITVQSYFRRWRAELSMYKHLYCATKIQAAFRGWLVRDTVSHKHFCATQIQRFCRGYLATMRVYEALYNITVVQSIARRNAAIKEAQFRFDSIVLIQSVFRGYKVRRQLAIEHKNATVIQTAWRGFIAQLNYQFDIVDIIIVQSIARMRAAQKRYATMVHKKHINAAIVIQKYWRSYDCTMNYLHSIADVLIVQSVVRRWIAMKAYQKLRKERFDMCATRIQKTWRGFKDYIDYIFTISDVVIVQKIARGWLAKRRVEKLKAQRGEEIINNAATTIQKSWKTYQAQMNMLFSLVHIIIVQSVVRRRIAMVKFKPMLMEHRAAITIQCLWRLKAAKKDFVEGIAARKIQAAVRGWIIYNSYQNFIAARKIQSWYRCQATRRGYLYYISARKIQSAWRGYDARKLAEEERWVREYAATMIQKNYRMFSQQAKYTTFMEEKRAATKIQSQWRCFWEYSHFVILRYELIRIQAVVRSYQTRCNLQKKHDAAIVIQKSCRVMLAKKYCHMERLFSAVMYSAQMALTYKNAAKKIQKGYQQMTTSVKEKQAALVIERFFIWVRSEVEREIQKRENVRKMKRSKQHSKHSANDNHLLDNVWDKTLEKTKAFSRASRTTTRFEGQHSSYKNLGERVRSISPTKSRSVSPTKSRSLSNTRSISKSRLNSASPGSPLRTKKIDYVHDNSSPGRSRKGFENPLDDDELSDVSGLTTPSYQKKHLDDALNNAWAETNRKLLNEDDKKSMRMNSLSPSRRQVRRYQQQDTSEHLSRSPGRSQYDLRSDMMHFSRLAR